MPETQTTSPTTAYFQHFHRVVLWFGHSISARCRFSSTDRGELRHPRLRHAGDTPPEQLAWRKTPITTGMENARGTEDPAAVPVSGKSPATGPKGGSTFGTNLSPHTHPHRISGTKLSPHTHPHRISGIKLSLLTRNGSIWRFFCMQGDFVPFSPPRSQAGRVMHRSHHHEAEQGKLCTERKAEIKRANTTTLLAPQV